jgi:uncharacterized protein (TIGR04222 family)
MNAKHVELLRRLEQFQLDSPEASLPFSARLARENNWSPAYAQRVITEYKRFAFLAIAAGHPVSPSEDVDQVWHLHLTYSENYWKVFCPEVLGQNFHHHPTRGGRTEHEKFNDWYTRTLKSYQIFFNQLPPADIWPSPETREKEKHDFTRVDRAQNWVIPKPRLRAPPSYAAAPGLMAITILCSGATLAQGMNVFDWRGPEFLGFYILFFPVCFGLALWLRWKWRVPTGAEQPKSELDGYATAFLNGGKVLTVNTAIANLINQKAMRVDAKSGRLTSLVPTPQFSHPLERLVYVAAESTDGTPVGNVRLTAVPGVTAIAEDLKMRGLVVADDAARKAILIPLLIAFAAIGVGVVKIMIGINRDRPVGYLVALCIIFGIISLVALARRPVRSRYGDGVLEQLRAKHIGPRELGRNASCVSAAEFATMVGLFGFAALEGSNLENLRQSLQPPANGSGNWSGCGGGSSCGGGGGCGGGGCGGGCGGCGGGGH